MSIVCVHDVRFAVREYEHDPQALEAERKEKEKLERDLKRQFVRGSVIKNSLLPLWFLFPGSTHELA